MAEAGAEAEGDLATPEAPPNPRIGVEVEATMMNIANGMLPSPLGMVEGDHPRASLREPGGRVISVVTAITPPKKEPRTGTTRMSPPIPQKGMMTERGLEAPAPEIIGTEEREVRIDTILEESTIMNTIETMGLVQVVETTAQVEETMSMAEQDTELILDPDIPGRVLQMKTEDTLVTTGDGGAKGP